MNKWAGEIKKVENGNVRGKNKEVSLAMIAANNHYAGFGPGTAILFRKMIGLSELYWEDQQQIQKHLQLRQQQQKEKQNQHVSNSEILSKKQIKNRQSSLTEFIDYKPQETQHENHLECDLLGLTAAMFGIEN